MKHAIFPVLLMALVLVSGFVQVNINHQLNLPKEILNRNSITAYTDFTTFSKVVDIYLIDSIIEYKQVDDVVKELNNATPSTVIKIHLAGYGGNVEVVERIINAIQASKGRVITIVEAPVYSGHAFLALAGDELIMLPLSYLMFHTSSAVNINCDEEEGVDRGMTNKEHCQLMLKNHLELFYTYIISMPILTEAEKILIMNGKDLYITAYEYNKRITQ